MPSLLRSGSSRAWPDLLLLNYLRRRNSRLAVQETQQQDPKSNKLLGCMSELAVGDVLGCPVEGMTFGDIREKYGEIQGLLRPPFSRHWRLPGLHSDDTQQALAVLAAIAQADWSQALLFRTVKCNRWQVNWQISMCGAWRWAVSRALAAGAVLARVFAK